MKPRLRRYFDPIVIAVLAVLSYALFFYGLGSIGLVGPDEPRYAAIAREMLIMRDYITPRLYGIPWFEKPPLMYWLAALGYKLFGISEAGARFSSALSATVCVFLIYWCGRKLWDRAVGFLAALVVATSICSFVFARAASTDMFISTTYGHDRPFFFFFPVLLLLTFPWTFLLISVARRKFGRNDHLLLWWAAVPFVFFSFSESKLPGYILPMVPPFALLMGNELWQPTSRVYRVAVFIEAGTLVFIGVAFGFFGNTLNVDPHVSGVLILAVTFG